MKTPSISQLRTARRQQMHVKYRATFQPVKLMELYTDDTRISDMSAENFRIFASFIMKLEISDATAYQSAIRSIVENEIFIRARK